MNFARAKTVSSRTPVPAVIAAVAVAALLALGSLVAFAAEAPQGAAGPEAIGPEGGPPAGVSTFQKPEGYEEAKAAQVVRPDAIVDQQSGARVLIMRESYSDRPWSNYPESSNVMVLQSFGFTEGTYGVVNTGDKYLIAGMYETSDFTTIDFNKFEVIIVENDNSQWFFDALSGVWQQIEQWVANGGVLVFHGAEVSWHGGRYGKSDNGNYGDVRPPGMTLDQSAHNVWYSPPGVLYQNWVDPIAHPEYAGITAGMVSPTWGNYTSHDVFYNVVEGGSYTDGPGYIRDLEVLTTDSAGRATSFVYHYPKDDNTSAGCVYFGGLTLEWGYYYNYDYGRKMLPQLLQWALSCEVQAPQPEPADPQISVSAGVLNVEVAQGESATEQFVIANVSPDQSSLDFSIASDASWLSTTPSSGTVANNADQTISVNINTTGLGPGNYLGRLAITSNDPANPVVIVSVVLTVVAPDVLVTPDRFDVTVYENYTEHRVLNIRNVGNQDLSVTIETAGLPSWLSFQQTQTNVSPGGQAEINIDIASTQQAGESDAATVQITTNDPDPEQSTLYLMVTRKVLKADPGAALLANPQSLSISVVQNQVVTRDMQVINASGGSLTVSVGGGLPGWLVVEPASLDIPAGDVGTFVARFDATGLDVDTYSGMVTFTAGGLTAEAALTMAVGPAPAAMSLGLSSTSRYLSPDVNRMDRGITTFNWGVFNAPEVNGDDAVQVGLAIVNETGEVVRSLIGSGTGLHLDYTRPFGEAGNAYQPQTRPQGAESTAWNGLNDAGDTAVEPGEYWVVLMAEDGLGRYSWTTQPIGIDIAAPTITVSIGSPEPQPEIPTVYYSVDIFVSVQDDLSGINFPTEGSPEFERLRPRLKVTQNGMEDLEAVVVDKLQDLVVSPDGKSATFRFEYFVVKAPQATEGEVQRDWDGPATVEVFVYDQSNAENEGHSKIGPEPAAFNVETNDPTVEITSVSPGSDSKDDPFRPEFKDGAYTTSAIKVRYTAKAKELEGSVRLKIYQGGTVTVGRDQFEGSDPMAIRTLGPIETGALSDPDGDGNYTAEVTFLWDGTNDVGDFVKSGVYKLVVKAEDNQGRASDTDDERIFVSFPPMVIGDLYVYPNPVKPGHQATFVMSLNRPSDVLLEIYNTAGERINAAAFTGRIGTQEYVWDAVTDSDGEPLVNGVYLYKVTVFDESNTPVYQVGRLFVLR